MSLLFMIVVGFVRRMLLFNMGVGIVLLLCRLEITVPVGWALNTDN